MTAKLFRPSPPITARPEVVNVSTRLSMNASKWLYIALSESTSVDVALKSMVSDGVKRSVSRGLLVNVRPVSTRGRGSAAVGVAL